MNRFLKALGGLLAASLLSLPLAAQAQELTVRVEPGVAVPLTKPQSDRFGAGGDVMAKLAVGLTPWMDLDPSVGVLVLPNASGFAQTGTAWMFGGGLRLKRPHDESNKGTDLSAVSPWVDSDLQYVRTGSLDRFGWNLAVGAAVPTSDARDLWVGPFVRYQSVFEDTKVGYDTSDAKVLVLGVSFEFGPSRKKAHVACPPVVVVPAPVPVPQPAPPVVVPVQIMRGEAVIQFNWDSAKLDSKAKEALDTVVAAIGTDHSDIVVEGHASSEGHVEHNNVLAKQRADSVLEYLVSKGVSRESLSSRGFGSTVPVASNKTKLGRERNRRAEFVVTFVVKKGK